MARPARRVRRGLASSFQFLLASRAGAGPRGDGRHEYLFAELKPPARSAARRRRTPEASRGVWGGGAPPVAEGFPRRRQTRPVFSRRQPHGGGMRGWPLHLQPPGANDGVIGEAPDSSPLVQDSVWRAWRRRYPCGWPSDPPPSPASGMLYVRFIRARNDFMMQNYHRIMGRDGDEALLPRELRKWESPGGRWHCPKCQCGRDTCPSWACWETEMEEEETA